MAAVQDAAPADLPVLPSAVALCLKLQGCGLPFPDDLSAAVLSFLRAEDLVACTAVCVSLRAVADSAHLWSDLYLRDFFPRQESACFTVPTCLSVLERSAWSPKRHYIARFTELHARGQLRLLERDRALGRAALRRQRERIEGLVDLLNLRLLPPVFALSLLVFSVLLSTWSAGGSGVASIWTVLSPLFVFFAVFGLAIASGCLLWYKRGNRGSMFFDMWEPYRGIIKFIMDDLLTQSRLARASGMLLYFLWVAFLVLIASKISGAISLSWCAAFVPFWVQLVVLALSPMLGWSFRNEIEPYAASMVLFFVPVTILSVVLPLRLDGVVDASLQVVFVPLWLINSCLLCIPLAGCSYNVYRRQEVAEGATVCTIVWCTLAPLIAFEVLLCANEVTSIDHGKLFAPLFLWLGFLVLFICVSSRAMKSAYHRRRERNRRDDLRTQEGVHGGIELGLPPLIGGLEGIDEPWPQLAAARGGDEWAFDEDEDDGDQELDYDEAFGAAAEDTDGGVVGLGDGLQNAGAALLEIAEALGPGDGFHNAGQQMLELMAEQVAIAQMFAQPPQAQGHDGDGSWMHPPFVDLFGLEGQDEHDEDV